MSVDHRTHPLKKAPSFPCVIKQVCALCHILLCGIHEDDAVGPFCEVGQSASLLEALSVFLYLMLRTFFPCPQRQRNPLLTGTVFKRVV